MKLDILVADDDEGVLASARLLFEDEGWKVVTVRSQDEVLRKVQQRQFDLAMLDLNYARNTTSGREGIELLARLAELDADLPVVVMTAWGSIDLAVEAMRYGAQDFLQKPWDNARVLAQVEKHGKLGRALRTGRLLAAENQLLRDEAAGRSMIAESAAMRPVIETVAQVAGSDANMLILGENGTGKGVLARYIHDCSARKEGPFISVNLGGLAESLFDSELFGHVRGAFTDARTDRVGRLELAKGGTLFLDEIGNAALPQQAKLLRLLETREFERVGSSRTLRADVRLVSATNAVLRDEVAAGRFREDLLYRLNTVTISLPPLRDRRDDLLPLARSFLGRHSARYRKEIAGFTPDAESLILRHSWPGNIRELDHAIERAVLMCRDRLINRAHLGLEQAPDAQRAIEEMSLEEVERLLIRKALDRHSGNMSEAARHLGLSRATLYRRLQDLGQ